MKDIISYISKQIRSHANYVSSFKRAKTLSNEQIHPKTGKTISNIETCSLIEQDAEKKAKAILKKLQPSTEMQNFIGVYKSFGVELLVEPQDDGFEVSLPFAAKAMAGFDIITIFNKDESFKEIILKKFVTN